VKIGFNMLLWTAHVQSEHWALLEDLKSTGYDGVEIPVFEGEPAHYAEIGRRLEHLGLESTGIGIIPGVEMNPIGEAREQRAAALKHIEWIIECAAAMPDKRLCAAVSRSGHAARRDRESFFRSVSCAWGRHSAGLRRSETATGPHS